MLELGVTGAGSTWFGAAGPGSSEPDVPPVPTPLLIPEAPDTLLWPSESMPMVAPGVGGDEMADGAAFPGVVVGDVTGDVAVTDGVDTDGGGITGAALRPVPVPKLEPDAGGFDPMGAGVETPDICASESSGVNTSSLPLSGARPTLPTVGESVASSPTSSRRASSCEDPADAVGEDAGESFHSDSFATGGGGVGSLTRISDGSTAGGVAGSKGGGSVGFLTWSSDEDESPGLPLGPGVEVIGSLLMVCAYASLPAAKVAEIPNVEIPNDKAQTAPTSTKLLTPTLLRFPFICSFLP